MNYKIRHPYMGSLATPTVFTMPSLTVPDMGLTVKQIMDRYARGLPIDGARVPYYEEDETEDDFMPTGMDKIETIEWMRSNKKRIEDLQSDLRSINEKQTRSQAAEKNPISVKTPPEAENTIKKE